MSRPDDPEQLTLTAELARQGRRSVEDLRASLDLRGTPKGATETYTFDRLVPPMYGKHRVREQVELVYCADGWHSDDGSVDQPSGAAICSTVFGRGGGMDSFRAFHEQHPVKWRVTRHKVRSREWLRSWYCDLELPEEYHDEVY